jgi:hypothetical protein
MKTLSLNNSAAALGEFKKATSEGYILLTHRGKPIAYILPTAFYDEEDLGYMTDPEFWKMVQEWRNNKKPGVPLEQVMARIDREELRLKNGSKSKNHAPKKTGKRNGSPRSK